MKLVFADTARTDLIQIGDRIAQGNSSRALTFVGEIEDRCRQLASMPEAYQLVPRHEASGVRRAVHGNYLIFFRVVKDSVENLHVLHGARDYEAILYS